MIDSRVRQLAHLALSASCHLNPGERVLFETVDVPDEAVLAFVREARLLGAVPFVRAKSERLIRELAIKQRVEDISLQAKWELQQMRDVDVLVLIRCPLNVCEMWDLTPDQLHAVTEHYVRPVHFEYRNRKMRFVTLRWPSPAFAQRAGMSTEAFEDAFFGACLVDYQQLSCATDPLVRRMAQTDQVHILGPGTTDLTFSIKGMRVVKEMGERNLPDGEVSTSPVRNSVNGRIHYNLPSRFYGQELCEIQLVFKNGRVEEMTCDESSRLVRLLDQDAGARFMGEFAIGLNPLIQRPMGDVLFDEKMAGTVHCAQGDSYGDWDNGNRSAVHLDFILSQLPAYGGGELFFDGELIRKNGVFLPKELRALNPDAILSGLTS